MAWIAVLPVAVGLAVGLRARIPRWPTPERCDDLLRRAGGCGESSRPPPSWRPSPSSPPAWAAGARSGSSCRPTAASPSWRRRPRVLVPIFLVAGPLLAGPFFGEVRPGASVAGGAPPRGRPRRRQRGAGGDRLSRGRPALGGRRPRPGRGDRRPGAGVRVRPPGGRHPRRRDRSSGSGSWRAASSPGSSPTGRGRSSSRSRPTRPSTSPWPWRSPAGSPERRAGSLRRGAARDDPPAPPWSRGSGRGSASGVGVGVGSAVGGVGVGSARSASARPSGPAWASASAFGLGVAAGAHDRDAAPGGPGSRPAWGPGTCARQRAGRREELVGSRPDQAEVTDQDVAAGVVRRSGSSRCRRRRRGRSWSDRPSGHTPTSDATSFRGMFVSTVRLIAFRKPTGSPRKPPFTTRSRIPDRTSCWRAWRVMSDSPAALRIAGVGQGLVPVQLVASGRDGEALGEAVLVVASGRRTNGRR